MMKKELQISNFWKTERKKNDGREMKMTMMLGGVMLVERSWNKKKRDCFYFLFFKCGW